jgi:hypothetical protein
MYSMQTGLLVKTLRSNKQSEKGSSNDAHKTNIVMLKLRQREDNNTPTLLSMDSQGMLAEWELESSELQYSLINLN